MADFGRGRVSALVFATGVAMATIWTSSVPALAAGPAVAATTPGVTITEECSPSPYGERLGLTGFPANTPFTAALSWVNGSAGPIGFTTDANGTWSFSFGSENPMGLVTFTVQALGQTFVATIQDPCDPPASDTVPPTMQVPPTVTANASAPAGAVVSYSVSVDDNRLPAPPAICVPPSGSTFPVGETTVTCTATDAAGNSTVDTFEVVVRSATDQLRGVRASVVSAGMPQRLTRTLTTTLDHATRSADAGHRTAACTQSRDFVSALLAQRGRHIDPTTADLIVVEALRARAAIGCAPLPSPFTAPTILLKPACDITHPDVGFAGHWGAALTLEGFEPGTTVALVFTASSVGVTLSYPARVDPVGSSGPIYAAAPLAIGTLTVTASVNGVQVGQASLQNPCDP
jgi:hypothetical protein